MTTQETTAESIAKALLEIKAVKLQPEPPFTWASGWKSPIYCDNRATLSYPGIRSFITKESAALVKKEFPQVQAIAGVATAGIAQGALVASALELPFVYVRAEAKNHGMGKQIEGRLAENQKVVVIEDLISTGKSSLVVVDALRAEGKAEVQGLVAIFNYGFPQAENAFKAANCQYRSLSNYEVLIKVAVANGYVKEEQLATLAAWRGGPETWGK